jgi:RimJ/RimL family protein N-acetyltransferase
MVGVPCRTGPTFAEWMVTEPQEGGRRIMTELELRLAGPEDRSSLDAFLLQHADSSLFLRFYLAQGGLTDGGKPLQGTYAIAVSNGQVVGVAMHSWHNVVFLQAPDTAVEVAHLASAKSQRPILALVGPWSQVEAARIGLGLAGRPMQKHAREDMFALNLSDLVVPSALGSSAVSCRRAEPANLDLLREWRFGYEMESTGLAETEGTRSYAAKAIEGHVERGEAFLLEVDSRPVSMAVYNARVDDMVQIGGVWTPGALRGRGYARLVVAGALQQAEREGIRRAVLYTEEGNTAARRAYEAIGFKRIGDYGVVVFST